MSEKITFDPESKPIVIACEIINGVIDHTNCLEEDPINILKEIAAHIETFCRYNRSQYSISSKYPVGIVR